LLDLKKAAHIAGEYGGEIYILRDGTPFDRPSILLGAQVGNARKTVGLLWAPVDEERLRGIMAECKELYELGNGSGTARKSVGIAEKLAIDQRRQLLGLKEKMAEVLDHELLDSGDEEETYI